MSRLSRRHKKKNVFFFSAGKRNAPKHYGCYLENKKKEKPCGLALGCHGQRRENPDDRATTRVLRHVYPKTT
ncbi:Uncharacterized protein APZ42_002134 [Daphnia magna]|uniref:Uncharacterized protein n=1 Tax=Daphnia magna TaxID=35525 RepID=A0A164IHG8_9CRUS|nr:Uncharacterized protein APZ42_002134 [Daphnia magna]